MIGLEQAFLNTLQIIVATIIKANIFNFLYFDEFVLADNIFAVAASGISAIVIVVSFLRKLAEGLLGLVLGAEILSILSFSLQLGLYGLDLVQAEGHHADRRGQLGAVRRDPTFIKSCSFYGCGGFQLGLLLPLGHVLLFLELGEELGPWCGLRWHADRRWGCGQDKSRVGCDLRRLVETCNFLLLRFLRHAECSYHHVLNWVGQKLWCLQISVRL